jgi:alpha-maltose-1-phosphate synthase
MSAAIYFHPEAYTTSGPKLMGRNAAGESFLRGYFLYSTAEEFWVQTINQEHAEYFAKVAQSFERNESVKMVTKATLSALSAPGSIYLPGPGISEHAYHRASFGDRSWSLCGITHTTSSAMAMDSIVDLITAPVQPWDALICTSTAVQENVNRILQAQADYLKRRLNIQQLQLPQLPVIPLGIHNEDFQFTATQKAAARSKIGADGQTHVVMFMGRLSFHAKAHPLAMYQALELVAQQLPENEKILLVECGWFSNKHIEKAYREAASQVSPSIRVVTLDGRIGNDRQTAWASADVFCSLSDNIQETFGIVPIEAMAAGIPVVVSDWDGYKDTVRDGVDGFRIPTLMPEAGLASDLALRHALEIDTYDMYCGYTCSLIAVDIQATVNAFSKLFASQELRAKMGSAGRQRAQEVYDWSTIIPQYEALWKELSELRVQAAEIKPLSQPWPARMDPFHGFSGYPTAILTADTKLKRVDASLLLATKRAEQYRRLAMVDFAKLVLPSSEEVVIILTQSENRAMTALELINNFPKERQPHLLRGLSWLVKIGILQVEQ